MLNFHFFIPISLHSNHYIANNTVHNTAHARPIVAGRLVACDAAVFHIPVNDIGTEPTLRELGALLGDIFYHKNGLLIALEDILVNDKTKLVGHS